MKKRIWELDAFRGLCILGMVLVHFVYDIAVLYKVVDWALPDWFVFVQRWGNIFFLLISGICVTLGSRCLKRGAVVFASGLLCTAVTVVMWKLGIFTQGTIIYFGVLHCLGVCMLLWPLFRRLPWWLNGILAAAMIAAGFYLKTVFFAKSYLLLPLGFTYAGFTSSDYFPLLPNLGYFLLGTVLGRLLYAGKESLLPRANPRNPIIVFFSFLGKHSLLIYLLHQPILSGLCMLLKG